MQIIDELIITLGFDTKGLKSGEANTGKALKNLREDAEKTGAVLEAGGRRASQFFALIKAEALGAVGVLTGLTGLMATLSSAASGLRDFGLAAQRVNMPPDQLDMWNKTLFRMTGQADVATKAFSGLQQKLSILKLMGAGSTDIRRYLSAIGANEKDTPVEIFEKFSAYAQREKAAGLSEPDVAVTGRGLGLPEEAIQAAYNTTDQFSAENALTTKLGLTTQAMIDAAQKFATQMAELEQVTGNLLDTIKTDLMPAATALLKELTDWFVAHPELKSEAETYLDEVGKALGDEIKQDIAFFHSVGEAFDRIAAEAKNLWQGFSDFTAWLDSWLPFAHKPSDPANPNSGNQPVPQGAGGGGFGENVGPPITQGQRGKNADAAIAYYKAHGYTDEQIAGLLGNFQAESSFDPLANEGNGAHLGIGQWDTTRQAEFRAKFGHAMNDPNINPDQLLQEQLQFSDWELHNKYKGILRGPQTASQAANALNKHYEVSGMDSAGREAAAEHWYNILRSRNKPPAVSPLFQLPPQPPQHQSLLDISYGYHARMASAQSGTSNDNTTNVHIAALTVNTAATDSAGISKAIHKDLSAELVRLSNRGLA